MRHTQQILLKKSVSSNLTEPNWVFGGMVYAIDLKSIFFIKCLVQKLKSYLIFSKKYVIIYM